MILLLGLQGAGKTTTAGKLAKWLTKQGKHPLLVSTDVKRPAAIQQLNVVAQMASARVHDPAGQMDPVARAKGAVAEATNLGFDTVIVDTAGRLHTDERLREELKKVVRVAGKGKAGAPHESLLVLDATIGQNAVHQAREFSAAVPLTGLVITKLDGTAKGGSVIALRRAVPAPIRFLGTGETLDDLEVFDPASFAHRLVSD